MTGRILTAAACPFILLAGAAVLLAVGACMLLAKAVD